MANGKSRIIGITLNFRPGKKCDSVRVGILPPDGKPFFWISAKLDPRLKALNRYLKASKIHEDEALKDTTFNSMLESYYTHLKGEYGLKEYQARQQVELNTKAFDFEASLNEFFVYKQPKVSNAYTHKMFLEKIWLPYFRTNGCKHPSDFKAFAMDAENFLRTTLKLNGREKYSRESLPGIASALHEYLKFLVKSGKIQQNETFYLDVGSTLEQKKRGRSSASRKMDTYTVAEMITIKAKIDEKYANDQKLKLRAYAILFGVFTGVRRGNLLGLKAKNLFPDDDVPHFEIADNVVPGYSRGQKGVFRAPIATKTSVGEHIALPLIQPSVETAQDVARFLKTHLNPEDPLIKCDPNRVGKWWKEISEHCGFKYLSPHDWKHSYATNGALNLHKWFNGNAYLLQQCCLHRKFETTMRYIRQTSKGFLDAFRKQS